MFVSSPLQEAIRPSSTEPSPGSSEIQTAAHPSPNVQTPCQFDRANDFGSAIVEVGSITTINAFLISGPNCETNWIARVLAVHPPLPISRWVAVFPTSDPSF